MATIEKKTTRTLSLNKETLKSLGVRTSVKTGSPIPTNGVECASETPMGQYGCHRPVTHQ